MPKLPRLFRVSATLFSVLMIQTWTTGNEVLSGAETRKTLTTLTSQCPVADTCPPVVDGARLHWVSRTENGDLYLMVRADCPDSDRCNAWFVERTARGISARLNVDGRFRVLHSNTAVPDVQTWRSVSENEFVVTRYSCSGGVFSRVENRSVYIVDGEECGNAADCYRKAQDAQRERHTGRALRILEKVHNLSFI